MFVGAYKLNRYLNSWLEKNGFECTVEFDLDFTYDQLNNMIHYTLVVPLDHDEMFINVCREYREELIDVDCFLLSFFHEVGHWVTEDMWSSEEWDEYDRYLENLPANMTDEDFNDYYHYPIEWEATKWACDFMVDNEQLVKNFWEELQPLIMEFYEVNGIETRSEGDGATGVFPCSGCSHGYGSKYCNGCYQVIEEGIYHINFCKEK